MVEKKRKREKNKTTTAESRIQNGAGFETFS